MSQPPRGAPTGEAVRHYKVHGRHGDGMARAWITWIQEQEQQMALQDLGQPIDLDVLARKLAHAFAGQPPTGRVVGRTAIKNAVAETLGCSELEAEQLVDSLVLQGKLAFVEAPETPGVWDFRVSAGSRRD